MADVSAALLPSVAPAGLPDDYQHIRADASSFGGEIAKGTEKLGAGFEKASENVFNINQFYGKVAVDDQINEVMTGSDRIRRGDPSRSIPGPDGAPQPDVGYMGLQGRAALEAREPTEKALDGLIEKARGNLKSPQEQLEFDTQTRRMRSLWINEISSHANSQFKTWTAGVNDSSAAHALNGFAANLDNPEAMASHAKDYIDFKVRNAQLKFGDDPAIVGQTIQSAKQELLKAQVAAKEVNDPVGALRILDKNREIAGTDYPALAERLRGRVDQQYGIGVADRKIAATSSRPYASLSNPSYAAAAAATPGGMSAAGIARTVQLESSGDPNAGAGGAHVGLGQFSVDTALQAGVANRNDPEQSVRGIATLSAQNAPALQKVLGRQPSDAELYLAHQQGAGGAAKLLANPDARAGDLVGDAAIKQNGGDPDAPARAFTALWKGKFDKAAASAGELGSAAALAHREGQIKAAILDDPELTARPQAQNTAIARVGAVFAAQRLQLSQDDAAFKLQVKNSMAEALDTGAVQSPIPREKFIASYGASEGETHYADYQANIQLGADLRATAVMSPAELAALREKYRPEPGDSYLAQRSRAEALDKVIEAHTKIRAQAFRPVLQNSTAEALDTGAVKKPLSLEEFTAALGPEEGERSFQEYQKNLGLGADIHAAAHLAPSELTALREKYSPQAGEDYITQSKRADALDKAIRQNEAAKAKDPAAFVIQRTEEGGNAFQQFQATAADPKATPAQRTIAASLYAEKMLAEQARLGVAPDARRIVPESYTDALAAKLSAPETQGGTLHVAQAIEAEASLWGEHHWPDVLRSLNPKVGPVVRVVSSGLQPKAAQMLVDLAPLSQAAIQKDEDTEKGNTIKKAVLTAFKPLADSMTANDGATSIFNDFRSQAEKLATMYVVQGATSTDAAARAWKEMIGFKYEFNGSIRLPKSLNIPMSEVIMGVNHFQTEIGKFEGAGGGGNLLERARSQYPILKSQDYGYVENFRPNAGFLEHWEPGDHGVAPTSEKSLDALRPKSLPMEKAGLEIRDPKTRPIDVLGDIVSHNLVKTDPTVKSAYEKLQASLTPAQQDILKDQYEHARKNEGETRSFDEWKNISGMPAFFRGYTFQQWPKEFNEKAYTPEQRTDLDNLMNYLSRDGKPAGETAPRFDIAPMRDNIGGLSADYLQRETLRAYARDGKWVAAPKEGDGLMFTYNGRAVPQKNGQPIIVPWAEIAARGRAALAGASTVSGVQP